MEGLSIITIKNAWKKYKTGTMLFLPFLILFCVFTVIPVVISFGLCLTDYDMLSAPQLIGFDNFKQLFLEDNEFSIALKNTLIFSCIVGPFTLLFQFMMAWFINQLKLKKVFTLAFYIPSISAGGNIIISLLFSNDRYGIINNILYNLGIINTPIMFSADKNWIMPAIIILYIWGSLGTGFLVFLAGLQNLDGELFEAGMVDGIKTRTQELWYITLPQMKPQLFFAAINGITGAFGVFDISVGFAGLPSANYAGHTLAIHIFDHAFIRFEMGYASASAVVLFALTYCVGIICRKLFTSKD